MPANFLNGLTGKLAANWIANLLTPAFIFWSGGLGAWVWKFGWTPLEQWFVEFPESIKFTLLVTGFLIVTVSAATIQLFDLLVIRFLEGYWTRSLTPFKIWFSRRHLRKQRLISYRLQCLNRKIDPGLTVKEIARYWESYWPLWLRPIRRTVSSNRYSLLSWASLLSKKEKPFQQQLVRPYRYRNLMETRESLGKLRKRHQVLKQKFKETYAISSLTFEEWNEYENIRVFFKERRRRHKGLTAQESNDYAVLEGQLKLYPAQPNSMMPTRLGNILRAAESRPRAKYGLDTIICWPVLWLVLPDGVKVELMQARASLDRSVRLWSWSILFTVWSIWAWWAFPIGILTASFVYKFWILSAATSYGQLLEATFDSHRMEIYKVLKVKFTTAISEEKKFGTEITNYLWRGSLGTTLKFDSSGDNENEQ
ncbi:MAG: hypothetical protein AAFN40_16980 [Cyanobacteria bacterium J06560_6]